jgi:hypothetical protein
MLCPCGTGSESVSHLDPEITLKAARRTFSAGDKPHVVAEADQRIERGQIGALWRREGRYPSQPLNGVFPIGMRAKILHGSWPAKPPCILGNGL